MKTVCRGTQQAHGREAMGAALEPDDIAFERTQVLGIIAEGAAQHAVRTARSRTSIAAASSDVAVASPQPIRLARTALAPRQLVMVLGRRR